ncbi:TPA: hypothetical protein EYP44_00420 [Candidatus Bathyarchaeota archaeon]|nr:hypothetical protein [Candidatus Bathyarchaeota archaeon]
MSASAYFPSPTDIDRAFKKLVRIFGRTSTIVDFDIDGTCEIPPLPGPELRDVKKVREVVDNLAKKTFMEIRSALPPDIRDKSNRVSLKGSFISVHARAIDDSITYDFSYTEDPLEAVPLAFFLYERAAEINEQSACISITRATKLKVININRINGYASVYIEPSW